MAINFWVAGDERTLHDPVVNSVFQLPSTFIKYYLQIKAQTYHLYSLFFYFIFVLSPRLSKDDCEHLKP